jgi:hypothetical protein
MPLPLWKRAAFVPFLLFALWLLTDNDTSESNAQNHHLAVFTALRRHPPCHRVYRSLLEVNLLLWGAVVSLWLWQKTIGKKMLGYLLFQPAAATNDGSLFSFWTQPNNPHDSRPYLPLDVDDFAPLHAEDILMLGKKKPEEQEDKKKPIISEEEALDADADADAADYDSDGEVSELTMANIPPTTLLCSEPPDVRVVTAAAVDSLVLILLSLFLFTLSSAEGGRYVDGMADLGLFRVVALVAAPLFPLLLFLAGVVAAIVPWRRKRSEFWNIVSFTIGAPMYQVTFRDGFIGDIFTSMIRPMRDTAFTLFYLVYGLEGWWKQAYDLDTAGDLPLESNWILHTVIFPMCMVSPLWWRFMQNLRQAYDHKKRWPYLGNALKYFVAAEVAMFGAFNPSRKQTFLWLSCFVMATLYQIWWDVVMDWELLVVEGNRIRLRKTRIYSVPWMYWTILVINVILRFGWTLSFLPPHYLNRAGVLSEQFEGDLSHILNPAIASAEILRRTLWGFLRVELEAIKVGRREPSLKGAWSDSDYYTADVELKVMAMEGIEPTGAAGWEDEILLTSSKSGWITNDMYKLSDLQILGELCIYSTAFTALGLIAAAHRLTY